MRSGLARSCPVCFAPAGHPCTRPTDTSRVAVQWLHLKREAPEPDDSTTAG